MRVAPRGLDSHMTNALGGNLTAEDFLRGRLTVSFREAARLLGMSRQTLYNQSSAGRCPIPSIKIGSRRLVLVADLLAATGTSLSPEPTLASWPPRSR